MTGFSVTPMRFTGSSLAVFWCGGALVACRFVGLGGRIVFRLAASAVCAFTRTAGFAGSLGTGRLRETRERSSTETESAQETGCPQQILDSVIGVAAGRLASGIQAVFDSIEVGAG